MVIWETIFCVFAAYGFFELLNKLYSWMLGIKNSRKPLQYILIVSKNNKDTIEYSIRNAMEKLTYGFEDVLVMDLESTDGTEDIVKKFAQEEKIRIVRWK